MAASPPSALAGPGGRAYADGLPRRQPPVETTLLLFKPDALQRGLVGRLLARFEDKGLQIVGLRLLRMTSELAARHYAPHVGKPFYPGLLRFMTAAPIIALALRGPKAVAVVRTMLGATFGIDAKPGTLRGDFGCSKTFNLLHASDAPETAARELELFFPDGLEAWEPATAPWLWDPA
ncbi:MAG: nucleoside-diphosphate kinase [Planctomycetota bacterium]|nr:MAG: nucleoside-diphosphate kinase [Planctomycetota bacterium]